MNPIYADVQCDNESNKFSNATKTLFNVVEHLDNCPKPTPDIFKQFCDEIVVGLEGPSGVYIKGFQFNYEKRLWDISCVKPTDTEETAKNKVRLMWSKYKKDFICDENGFGIGPKSLLKYSIYQNFPDLLETLLMTYEVDVNFVDELDNKNVVDYINDEIKRLNPSGTNPNAYIKKLTRFKAKLMAFGALPSK